MPQQNVAKMSKDADELHRKFYPEQYGDPPLDLDPEDIPAEPEKNIEATPTEPESSAASTTPAPPEGTPEVVEPASEAAAPAETPSKEPAPEPWESRYRTLQGKYDAEVPRLFAEINALKKQLAQPVSAPAPAPVIPPSPAGPLDIKAILAGDKDLEQQLATFSEDYPDVSGLLVKLTERAASVNAQRMNEAINAQVQTAQTVQEMQAESRNQHYWDIVNRELPDWQETRNDPDFAIWLGEVDPYTGITRGELTQDAITKNDAHRVVNIYKGFRASKSTDQHRTTSNQSTANPAAALVAPPSGSRSAPTLATQNKETPITSAYIKQFYNDAAKGKYRANEKEFNIIETRINRAVAEGKVS
jgi:hypothetical protein